MRPDEIAFESGYGVGRVNQLLADPTMQARIEAYRELAVNPEFVEAARSQAREIARIQRVTTRLYAEKLEAVESVDDISFRDLDRAFTNFSDRSGFGKVATTKIEADLSDRLAQALVASGRVIEHRQIKDITPGSARSDGTVGSPSHLHAVPVKKDPAA